MREHSERRDCRVGDWTAGQVLTGLAGVLGVGALVGWYFRETLKAYLPSPARLAGLIRQRDLPLPAGERFVVLVADLQGDDDKRTHTRHVAAALEPYRGLDVIAIGPGPEWGIESREAFEAKARALLAKRQGDVLITGDVATAGKGVRLRILPADRRIDVEPGASEGRRAGEYALTDTGLPLDFDRDFDAVLVALVAASVAPATERQGQYLVDMLRPAAGRLEHLCAQMPAGMNEDGRGGLWHALALAASVLGEQTGESAWLEEAVAAYRAALEVHTRERVPLDWAMIHDNLGNALSRLGEREAGTDRLQEAVAAHRAALEVLTRERVPLDWAMTQNNLGAALQGLGEREDGTQRLQEAVAAFRAALEVRTRQRVPLCWAMTQNNLGLALQTLGAREDGTQGLQEAVAAFRAALEVRTRERVPLDWAMTQNNLGNALWTLGEREDGTQRLQDAVAAYRAALEVYTRERVPLQWATTQNNLGNALSNLGEREDGTQRLREAVAAYRAALEVRTRERGPLDWATTQNNLGTALETLGEREDGTEMLEQAVAAYSAALEVFRPAGASHYVGMAERNLARAEALFAERRGKSAAE
jgi:tetratricopeptide (TPR) repeat protein